MSSNTTWVAVERCNLCERTRKNFACCKCIKAGNFASSTNPSGESFANKRERFLNACTTNDDYRLVIEERIKRDEKYCRKKNELLLLRDRVSNLRKLLNERKEVIIEQQNDNQKFMKKLFERKDAYKSLTPKREQLLVAKVALTRKRQHEEDNRGRLHRKRCQLKEWQAYHVRALVKYIFPISERKLYPEFGTTSLASSPSHETGEDDIISEVISAAELELEDATRIVHVDGHWIPQDFEDTEYTIVKVGMPASKDFMKYYEWLKSYRNEPKKHESQSGLHSNAVLTIPASLVYTTQLTTGLSSILGVNLPHHVEYYDFSIFKVSRRRLFNLVNKLSRNVMHLCFSQALSLEDLNPQQMLRNLRILVSHENIGWWGSFDTEEYRLNESVIETDSSEDDEDEPYSEPVTSIDTEEWDKLLDMPLDPSEIQSDISTMASIGSSPRDRSLSSSATDLVSSAAASVMSYWSWKR